MTTENLDIKAVEQEAAKYGIVLSPEDYAIAQQAADARRAELESTAAREERGNSTGRAAWVAAINRSLLPLLKALGGAGDIALAITQTVLIAFGVPLVLIMLLIVEQQRVYHGVALFEVSSALAAFAAWVLVLAGLVTELLIAHIERRTGWEEPQKHAFSLRLVYRQLRYIVGGGGADWTPALRSPAARFRAVLKAITLAILLLAVGGSMRPAIEKQGGDWLGAIGAIITNSTLLEMVTWVAGLLFAVTAVLLAQALGRYVSERVAEVVAILSSAANDKGRAIAEAAGYSAAFALLARVQEKRKERREMARVSAHGGGMPEGYKLVRVSGVAETAETAHGKPDQGGSFQGVAETVETPEKEHLSPAVAKGVQWLQGHPEHADKSLAELAEITGISRSTLSRAKAWIKKGE